MTVLAETESSTLFSLSTCAESEISPKTNLPHCLPVWRLESNTSDITASRSNPAGQGSSRLGQTVRGHLFVCGTPSPSFREALGMESECSDDARSFGSEPDFSCVSRPATLERRTLACVVSTLAMLSTSHLGGVFFFFFDVTPCFLVADRADRLPPPFFLSAPLPY